jgi:hypothetical protein
MRENATIKHSTPEIGEMKMASDPILFGTTLSPTQTGTLFLKINDSSGELGDNAGELKLKVRRE